MIKWKGTEYTTTLQEQYTVENGSRINMKAEGFTSFQTEVYMMVNGGTVNSTEKESTLTGKEQSGKENLWRESIKAKCKKYSRMKRQSSKKSNSSLLVFILYFLGLLLNSTPVIKKHRRIILVNFMLLLMRLPVL